MDRRKDERTAVTAPNGPRRVWGEQIRRENGFSASVTVVFNAYIKRAAIIRDSYLHSFLQTPPSCPRNVLQQLLIFLSVKISTVVTVLIAHDVIRFCASRRLSINMLPPRPPISSKCCCHSELAESSAASVTHCNTETHIQDC